MYEKEKRFNSAGGVIPIPVETPVTRDTSEKHYKSIITNKDHNIWHASKGRTIHINELGDKHLVNIIRYLRDEFLNIKFEYIKILDNMLEMNPPYILLREVNLLKQSITTKENFESYFIWTLPCFTSLRQEFLNRFGSNAWKEIQEGR